MQQTICKNCGATLHGKYCSACGEKVYTEKDKKVSHFFEEGFHFVTHFEGTLFNTIKAIFGKPGQLSLDYCNGIRKKYFKPLSFFLLLILLYLLFPLFEGLNMRFQYHLNGFFYGDYALQKAKDALATGRFTEAELAVAFNQKSERVSKFMLLVLLPLTALFFWAVAFRKRRHFFDHMVFSIEANSVYLIWGFLIMPLLITLYYLAWEGLFHTPAPMSEAGLGLASYMLIGAYVFRGIQRFYGYKPGQALALTLLFALVHEAIVQVIYKFLLFEVTMRIVT